MESVYLLKYSPDQFGLVKEVSATCEPESENCVRVYGDGESLVGLSALIINAAVSREEAGKSFVYVVAETREKAYKVLLAELNKQRTEAMRKVNDIVDAISAVMDIRDGV